MVTSENLVNSKKSFFNRAAWCSIFIPVITFVPTYLLGSFEKIRWELSTDAIFIYLLCAFCLQIISLILGLVSFFGIPKYGARLIVWKAVVGVLASCDMGFFIFAFAIGMMMERSHS